MSSKSQFYKNLKKEKERIRNILSNTSVNDESTAVQNVDVELFPVQNVEQPPIETMPLTIRQKLRSWVIQYQPSVESCRSLFSILREENLDVPMSLETLIGPRNGYVIRTVDPGEYVHIGLTKQIRKILNFFDKNVSELCLDIGIDGLPLYKSSSVGLWPILGRIVNPNKNIDVFLIGTYIGVSKPSRVDVYLHDFLSEYNVLRTNGLVSEDRSIKISIRAFICDTPARAYLQDIKGHTSFRGCSKCQQVGKRIGNTNTFSTRKGLPRTDISFSERLDPDFHQAYTQNFKLDLEKAGIKMISQFPVEPMHLVDLGVMKKMLNLLLKNKTVVKLNKIDKLNMSTILLGLSPYIPKEFARKPRSFNEVHRWKATEFRQFLLYTGVVVLKEILPLFLYNHFLLLHCTYRILLHPMAFNGDLTVVDKMIQRFVKNFSRYYGNSNVSYNVHNLLHLRECANQFGPLTDISAYPYENFMKSLKRKVKTPRHIGKQIFNQFSNAPILHIKLNNGPKKNRKGEVVSFQRDTSYFTNETPNNICLCNGQYVLIVKIFEDGGIIGKSFNHPKAFFKNTLNSMDLGICLVNFNNMGTEIKYNVQMITNKMIALPYKNNMVLIPLIHSYT